MGVSREEKKEKTHYACSYDFQIKHEDWCRLYETSCWTTRKQTYSLILMDRFFKLFAKFAY